MVDLASIVGIPFLDGIKKTLPIIMANVNVKEQHKMFVIQQRQLQKKYAKLKIKTILSRGNNFHEKNEQEMDLPSMVGTKDR